MGFGFGSVLIFEGIERDGMGTGWDGMEWNGGLVDGDVWGFWGDVVERMVVDSAAVRYCYYCYYYY